MLENIISLTVCFIVLLLLPFKMNFMRYCCQILFPYCYHKNKTFVHHEYHNQSGFPIVLVTDDVIYEYNQLMDKRCMDFYYHQRL